MAKDDDGNARQYMSIAIDNLISARTWMVAPEAIEQVNEIIRAAEKLKFSLPKSQAK